MQKMVYLFVNPPHYGHLLIAFNHIRLIDAKSVDPIVLERSEYRERLRKVDGDIRYALIEVDRFSWVYIIPPDVGKSGIFGVLGERCNLQMATDRLVDIFG